MFQCFLDLYFWILYFLVILAFNSSGYHPILSSFIGADWSFLSFSNYIWVWAYLVLGFRQWVLQLRIRKTVLSAGSRPATALMRGQGPSLGAPGPLGGLPWLCFGTQDIPLPLLSPPTLMSQRVSWLLQLRTSTIQPCSHLPGSGFCFESLYFLLTKKHR